MPIRQTQGAMSIRQGRRLGYSVAVLLGALGLSSCFSVNDDTVSTMSSFLLCDVVYSPKYIALPSEKEAARKEIKRRGVRCGDGHITRARRVGRARREPNEPRKAGSLTGTGFVINTSGDVLTNAHVAGNCRNIWVRVEGVVYPGVLRATDKVNDLAVVRFSDLPVKAVARFTARPMQLGSSVVAFGYPLTNLLGDDLKATTGNISGLSGTRNNSSFFQFTAPIQPGNSGGPVVDSTGAVAGIVSSKLKEIYVAKRSGTLPQLVNFGIKSRTARGFLQTHNVRFSLSRSSRPQSTVAIASSAQSYTIKVACTQ
jgi:S1-C subfamily serine protease